MYLNGCRHALKDVYTTAEKTLPLLLPREQLWESGTIGVLVCTAVKAVFHDLCVAKI